MIAASGFCDWFLLTTADYLSCFLRQVVMQIHLSRPDITEKEIDAVCRVLRSPNLSLGPELQRFEQAFAAYLGRKYAVAVNSGTSALFLCMHALGIGAGDQVITTPFTFIATVNAIMMVGAEPVFVDIDPANLNMDPAKIEPAITPKTKAILPVEVFGNPAGFDQICRIADKHHLPVVEDSCEALGSALNGKKAGTFGRLSVFGFYPNKQITTGEGGMIVTDDDNLADICISLRNQGRAKQGGWLSHNRLGYNFRLSDINCALGLAQLARIDRIKSKRKTVACWYRQMLADEPRLIVPVEPENCDMSWFVFVVRLTGSFSKDHRDRLIEAMNRKGIQLRDYFTPVLRQPFIVERLGPMAADFPITDSISQRTLALPFHNNLTKNEATLVCERLKAALDEITN